MEEAGDPGPGLRRREGGRNGKANPTLGRKLTRARISNVLVVLWVAFLGADRLDLLGGRGSFVFTPFFLLTAVSLGWEGLRALMNPGSLRLARGLLPYLALLLALMTVVFVSTFFALDGEVSIRRALHLAAIGLGTLGVSALLWACQDEIRSALVGGAGLGLGVAVLFNILEIWALASGFADPVSLGPVALDLRVAMYQGTIPRLSGQVADPNRAGFLFLLYVFVILQWARHGVSRWVGVALGAVLIVLTLSRSAALAAGVAALAACAMTPSLRVNRGGIVSALAVVALGLALLLAHPRAPENLARFLAPVVARASIEEGSAREHFHLLRRGWDEATASWKTALVGLGYGTSFMVLQDIFPGNKYGNFHSLYITFLAESGFLALLLVLLLLVGPLLHWSRWTPLVAGTIVFNFFYQSAAEPAFWFVLAMAWASTDAGPGQGVSEVPSR